MSEETPYVHTIFKTSKITLARKSPEYLYWKTTEPIEEGEILLFEHCYSTPELERLVDVVKHNSDLYNNLKPINDKWTEKNLQDTSAEFIKHVTDKVQNNASKSVDNERKYYTIGKDINYFNNSARPNAILKYFINDEEFNVPIIMQYIVSDRRIEKDEEITVWYGNDPSQEGVEYKSNEETYKAKFKEAIRPIYEEYLATDTFKKVLFSHMCIHYGLYLVNDSICLTPRFIEYLNKMKIKNNMANIKKWIYTKANELDYYLKNDSQRHEYDLKCLGIDKAKLEKKAHGARIVMMRL